MYQKNIFLLIIVLSTSIISLGQNFTNISVALMNESISLPTTRFTPINPGLELGISLKETIKPKSITKINLYSGFFHHKNIENAFYLKTEFLYRILIQKHPAIDLFTGLGYMHTFNPTEIYEVNDSGEFEKITQYGRPHFIANAGLGIAYLNKSMIEPFLKYHFMIETPFANGIPVIPHSILLIGINIKIKQYEN